MDKSVFPKTLYVKSEDGYLAAARNEESMLEEAPVKIATYELKLVRTGKLVPSFKEK